MGRRVPAAALLAVCGGVIVIAVSTTSQAVTGAPDEDVAAVPGPATTVATTVPGDDAVAVDDRESGTTTTLPGPRRRRRTPRHRRASRRDDDDRRRDDLRRVRPSSATSTPDWPSIRSRPRRSPTRPPCAELAGLRLPVPRGDRRRVDLRPHERSAAELHRDRRWASRQRLSQRRRLRDLQRLHPRGRPARHVLGRRSVDRRSGRACTNGGPPSKR